MLELDEMMRGFTIIATTHGMKLKGKRRWYWRMRVALWLFRIGAGVAGLGYEEEMEDYDGQNC